MERVELELHNFFAAMDGDGLGWSCHLEATGEVIFFQSRARPPDQTCFLLNSVLQRPSVYYEFTHCYYAAIRIIKYIYFLRYRRVSME